jgi:type I restriction enzyme, R subunit
MHHNSDSEQSLEDATVDLFRSLGYATLNAEAEFNGISFDGSLTGRAQMDEVVLVGRLRDALLRLNPTAPPEAIANAIEQLTQDRSLLTMVNANQQIYDLVKDGVKATFTDEDGAEDAVTLTVIDWNEASHNDWLAVQQLWVLSLDGLYRRRADIVLFINGLPLVFIELKTFHRNVERAYRENFKDYKDTIPHLFWYNAFVILSNGRYSRMGSITASWEHFHEWKKVSDEREEGRIDLETMLLGTCDPSRLLDLVENFTLFKFEAGGHVKLVARNHQFLGVNNAIQAVQSLGENQGRLGVFWHTQGSGKSYSMVFFSQKVMRKITGNWTFLIVTDRQELDEQIYENFADIGAIPKVKASDSGIQAQTGDDLKQLLRDDHRYLFTLIQKFHTRPKPGKKEALYPELSDRDNVIVMTDEAHRSQYDTFAANMRRALPEAAFIGFTGTPLMAGEERTKQVFGDYVSIYDFKQSVEDGATVPLYYENRIPKLQLTNDELNGDMEALLDAAMLDDEQETRLERDFKQEYQLITRDNRQETIAQDIVSHFMARAFAGRSYNSKGMVVCIDKLTAVRLHELVNRYWHQAIDALKAQLKTIRDRDERKQLRDQIKFMQETDMAVVISQAQGEIEFFERRGIDIRPHRARMMNEALDTKFKKPDDPFRLVFVCAMWMTGFDAPACSTIYLDKPMRNHTLMQTIARANRVFRDKQDGLIVDYVGVFRNLEKALAIYGTGSSGTDGSQVDKPIHKKQKHLDELAAKVDDAITFCDGLGIDLNLIQQTEDRFERDALKADAVETILIDETTTQQFLIMARDVNRLVKANRPHPETGRYEITRKMLLILAEALVDSVPDIDISLIEGDVSELLDSSVETEEYIIGASPTDTDRRLDLSQIDFDALKQRFELGHKRTATERLRGAINNRLRQMVRQNRTRMNFRETFQQMIDEYNSGSVNVEEQFQRLMTFYRELDEEEQRTLAEGLTEEELAIFDLLTKPEIDLTDEERDEVKYAAQSLLSTLKKDKLGLDWRKKQQAQAEVQQTIRVILDNKLPEKYDADLYNQKCIDLYQHVYESYFGAGKSVFGDVA